MRDSSACAFLYTEFSEPKFPWAQAKFIDQINKHSMNAGMVERFFFLIATYELQWSNVRA